MGMQDIINERKSNRFRFEILDDDALIYSHQYDGMRLSDIFIINSSYIDWILGYDNGDEGLKMIAQGIKDNYERTSESIDREIALK